ncbi:MAG TPA: MCE family protein [Sulfurovum sp.]|nr:MCE family protein [Sulfurovum sp.]
MSQQIPEIRQSSKFNFITSIWIVPFIALIIAGWLAYQFFADRGPEIRVVFPVNEGLVAGQSVVKFRNVPVGKVTAIHIEDNAKGVIVVIRMNTKRSIPYLTEKARFWIVKPEVGLGGISGLDTLISGTYINIYSEEGGKEVRDEFVGLSQPYRDTMKGEYFHLVSFDDKNIAVGMPVYYKNIKVGQVEYLYLGLNNKSLETIIYIDKQYAHLVHDDSKFWIKSTFNVDFTKGNIDVNVAPLNFMLQGGIVFSSPGKDSNDSVANDRVFVIYSSKTKAQSKTIGSTPKKIRNFKLFTEEASANLRVSAPVRFFGYDIGWVSKVEHNYNKTLHKMSTEICIALDTSVFEDKNDKNTSGEENLYQAVRKGLRARLDTLDIISGMLYVNLYFDKEDENVTIVTKGKHKILPMSNEGSASMMGSLSKMMDKLSKLPLEKLVNSVDKVINEASEPIANANELLKELKKSAADLNEMTRKKTFKTMPDEVNKTIKELTRTLKSTRKVIDGYGKGSMMNEQLTYTLEILTKTSKEMEVFLRMLNRKPNSLIFGD